MACGNQTGKIIRLYAEDEEHEWTDHTDENQCWLLDSKYTFAREKALGSCVACQFKIFPNHSTA